MSTRRTASPQSGQRRGILRWPSVATRRLKGGYGNLRVTGKLWLGFGLVLGIVVALGIFVAVTVNRLENILNYATTVAEPLSAAAYEMEINAIGSGMGVMTYLHKPDDAFVARFQEDLEEFEAFQRKYDSVAPSPEARELGRNAAETYTAYQSLGARLIDAKDREVEAINRFAAAVGELDRLLVGGTNQPAGGGVTAAGHSVKLLSQIRAKLLSQIRADLAELSVWLVLQFKAAGGPGHQQLLQRTAETRKKLGLLTKLLAESRTLGQPTRLDARLEGIFGTVDEILAAKNLINENVPAFIGLRDRLDGILDEEVQIFAQRELLNTQRRASQKSGELQLWLVVSGALVLLLAAVATLVIAKAIVGPVRVLAEGTKALGSGQLDHRIQIISSDEFGQLAVAFNQMAMRLQKATGNLEIEVQHRTADLSEAKRSLEDELARRLELEQQLLHAQKMESLGTLAGGIAHDFNNMLYVMLGSTQLASESLAANSKVQTQLARVLKAGRRSKSLVQKILSFSRRDAAILKPVSFAGLVRDALDLLRASLPPTVELKVDIDPDCGTVLADSAQLEQVIVNLGVNAFQAVTKGRGSIWLTVRRVQIDQTMAVRHIGLEPGAHAFLTVRDNGCGIPPELLPKVMDPFFTTKSASEGTGLGLSVVHGIVTFHHGTITLNSQPGQGTTVKVLLPLYKSEAGSKVSTFGL